MKQFLSRIVRVVEDTLIENMDIIIFFIIIGVVIAALI